MGRLAPSDDDEDDYEFRQARTDVHGYEIKNMCKALHLAAERELPLVAWNQERPGFNVDVANHGLAEVKRHFTLPHIVYAGSHTGCGCGFCWLAPDGYRVEALDAEDIDSTKGLLIYLVEALKTNDAIEAYGCWEGVGLSSIKVS